MNQTIMPKAAAIHGAAARGAAKDGGVTKALGRIKTPRMAAVAALSAGGGGGLLVPVLVMVFAVLTGCANPADGAKPSAAQLKQQAPAEHVYASGEGENRIELVIKGHEKPQTGDTFTLTKGEGDAQTTISGTITVNGDGSLVYNYTSNGEARSFSSGAPDEKSIGGFSGEITFPDGGTAVIPALTSQITWEAVQMDGEAGKKDSVSILFMFDADPGALSADAITLPPAAAIKGDLTGEGETRYLALAMVKQEGEAAVSINMAGIAPGPKKIPLYRQARANGAITWLIEASGHEEAGAAESTTAGGKSTSRFTFTFSAPVENLLPNEIALGIDGWNTLSLTPNQDNTIWTMQGEILRDIKTNRWFNLQAVINHSDVNQTDANEAPPKYYLSVCMDWTGAQEGGSAGTANSTAINITFDFPLSNLTIDEVTIQNGTGADGGLATKGTSAVTGSGKDWRIPLAGVDASGYVTVLINKAGVFRYGTAENPANNAHLAKKVEVYSALAANNFTVAEFGGTSGTVSSTALTLTFNRAVASLAQTDIVITGNGGGANINGNPTSSADKKVWTVPVSVGLEGSIKVKIPSRPGITTTEETVTVFKKPGVKTNETGNPDLEDFLAGLPSNTAATPATVRLHSEVILANDWALVHQKVNTAAKYVILDLSACPDTTMTGKDTGSGTPTGNDFNIIRNNQYIKGIILPVSLTVIGDNAFDGCDYVNQIGNETGKLKIPARITQIGARAFRGINNIPTLVFEPRSGAALSIGASAFATTENTGRTTDFGGALVLPPNTNFTGASAFECRSTFTSLVIESGCTEIPANTFKYCMGLSNVTIPATVITAGGTSFARVGNTSGSQCLSVTLQGSSTTISSTGLPSSLRTNYAKTDGTGGAGTYTRPDLNSSTWTKQ